MFYVNLAYIVNTQAIKVKHSVHVHCESSLIDNIGIVYYLAPEETEYTNKIECFSNVPQSKSHYLLQKRLTY